MADIFPFQALRYDPSKVSPAQVVTQPYDKITPAMQDQYYAASPYNLVRVILGKSQPNDNDHENVYSRAQLHCTNGALKGFWSPTPHPAFTSTLKLSKFLATLRARLPNAGGLSLWVRWRTTTTRSSTVTSRRSANPRPTGSTCYGPRKRIVGRFSCSTAIPPDEIDTALRQSGPPTVEVRDQYDVLHRLWKVSDPATIKTVQTKMADKKLIIADGHHRYETALTYRNEMRNQGKPDLGAPSERVMMTFVNMDAPGLVVLPTHRVVFGMESFDIAKIGAKLQENFEVENLGPLTDAAAAVERLHQAGKDTTALLAVTSYGGFLAAFTRQAELEKSRGTVGAPACTGCRTAA